jgi:hypothetical protein
VVQASAANVWQVSSAWLIPEKRKHGEPLAVRARKARFEARPDKRLAKSVISYLRIRALVRAPIPARISRLGVGCLQCAEGMVCLGGNSEPLQAAGYWAEVIDQTRNEYSVFL